MKVLFFATGSFPYGKSEPLVANQIESLSKDFDKIIIISSEFGKEIIYDLPSNVKAFCIDTELSFSEKLIGIKNIFSKYCRKEIHFIKKTYETGISIAVLKVLLNSISNSKRYKKLYLDIIKNENLSKDQLFFHSYWCTESVIGYCMLKSQFPEAHYYSRIHAYDLYIERHTPNYIPLRSLIIDNIDKLFFVSAQGKDYYQELYKVKDENKFILNRLGVSRNDNVELLELFDTESKTLKIVSCSSLIKLKRVHLMIEALALIEDEKIEWIHFGDGLLKQELENLVNSKLSNKDNVNFQFYGTIDNKSLLDYYAKNKVDLFVNTSQYEGLPISIMEAMAYGIPSIATNVGGVSEIVNSSNGYLLPVDFKVEELKDCIIRLSGLSKEDKNNLRLNAFNTWRRHFHGKDNYAKLIKEMISDVQECSRCLYNTKVYPSIKFDDKGVCNICNIYDNLHSSTIFNELEATNKWNDKLREIKSHSKNKQYDCLIGVSGGVDSTYVAVLAKKWGLKPLILHVDNGWNSELATQNIENIVKQLDFDLYTHVIDWEEMRDVQLAFMKASVVDIDVPFDNAIMAVTFQIAKKYNIKYVLTGINTVTEGWMPTEFSHYKLDALNIKSIQKKFGKIRLTNYPIVNPIQYLINTKIRGIELLNPLDCVDFNKNKVKKMLIDELQWRDYGGKHFENVYTKFYQGYILNEKFKFDKRISHFSTLICSNQMTKVEAKKEIENPSYKLEDFESDRDFFIKKMELNQNEFDELMKLPIKKHTDYPSYLNIIARLSRIKNFKFFN